MYVKTIERVGYNRMIRYNAKIMSIVDIEGMKPKNVKEVLIIQVDDRNTDFWIPSQLTDYTRFVHVNSSINTKVKSIRAICGFLNYIKEQVILGYDECFYRLKTKGIHELKHIHLANYINYLTDKTTNIYETVKDKEAILIRFYDFLYLKGVTSGNDAKILHKVVQMGKKGTGKKSSNRGKVVLVSPFEGNSNYRVKYPPKSRKSKPVLKDMAQEVWEQMIEYAEKYYPQIAFGVALQCMGGLRIGEVVNLALDSVIGIREDNYLTADIKDRFDEFFGDRDISPLKSQLKSDSGREQLVFNFNGELFNL